MGGVRGFVFSCGATAVAAPVVSTTTTTKPGPIVTLDPITVNIAGDRFLKIGLGIQLSGKVADQPAPKDSNDPTKGFARALDLTIETFGGHSYDSLVTPIGRAAAKEELAKKLEAAYPEEGEGVYFTNFLMH